MAYGLKFFAHKGLPKNCRRRHLVLSRLCNGFTLQRSSAATCSGHATPSVGRARFHLLVTEGSVHFHQNHRWTMETLARICAHDSDLLLTTPPSIVDVNDHAQIDQTTAWWAELTASGGDGMVLKPLDFIRQRQKGAVEPAIKCSGRE